MYELISLTENDYYVDCPAKMGLIRTGAQTVAAVDSGSDKDAGKKLLKAVDGQGWKLEAVYLTHSHADHTGGCALLQERTGCRVFASGMERDFTVHTVLEPALLWGGNPPKELRNKFLLAKESRGEELTEEKLPEGVKLIHLPGHSFDMKGYLTPDGTAYIGDAVSSKETLDKYGISFLWDVGDSLAALDSLCTLEAARFVPAHAPVTEDIRELAEYNRSAILTAAGRITELCAAPVTFETLLAGVFRAYGMTMNAQQYGLIGSTVRSYLSYLLGQGAVKFFFENEQMLWERA